MKIYISFGQIHAHRVNGKTFDCNSIAAINCIDYADGRKKAFEYFDNKFCFDYTQAQVDKPGFMDSFSRGIIEVKNEAI